MATLTLISQPELRLHPAYRPLVFIFHVNGTITDYEAAIKVQPLINGVAFKNPISIPPRELEVSGSSTIHKFEVDLSERVQSYFDPSNFFLNPGSPESVTSDNFQALLSCEVSYYYPDTDGILQLQSGTKSSSEIEVINAYRRGDEDTDLSDYDLLNSSAVPTSALFLTRKPSSSIVCIDDSETISIYSRGLTAYRIRSYDKDGASQGDGVLFLGVSAYGAKEVATIPIGPANINNVDPGDWFSGSVTIDSDTRYYLIQVGLIFGSTFISQTPIRRYYLVPSYCRKHRIHFLNSFGFVDSFSIWNNRLIEYDVTSETFSTPLNQSGSLIGNGGVLDSSREAEYSIKSPVGNLSSEEQEWISQDFSLSPRVMVEEGSLLIPFVISPGSFTISDDSDANPSLSFTMTRSVRDNSQRN